MMKLVLASCLVAVALAAQWTPSKFVATDMIGLSFPAAKTGYVCGGESDGSKFVKKTTDGGVSWTDTKIVSNATIIFFDLHCDTVENCAMAGLGVVDPDNQFTVDGETWHASLDFELQEGAQSVQSFGTPGSKPVAGHFGITGNFGATNGVAVSQDGGLSYKTHSWNYDKTEARYGSFPSADTWYIAGGNWPETNMDANKHYVSRNVYYEYDPKTQRRVTKYHGVHNPPLVESGIAEENQNYTAAIQKTTDGGKTFTNVYLHANDFYFNQISCPSTDVCFAVAEGFGENGGPVGGWIFATNDGGKTWTQQLFAPSDSLMSVRCISTTSCFAAGAHLQGGTEGAFYETTDGKSWTLAKNLPGVYFQDLAMVSATEGYATAVTPYDVMEFLTFA